MSRFRRYFIAGLLLWVPIWVTFLLVRFLVDLMDKTLQLLPAHYQPDYLLNMHIPGLGLIFTLLVLLITGLLITNIVGNRLLNIWEKIIDRIPLIRSIYHAVKQVVQTFFSSSDDSFKRVFLIEYPRKGLWSIAFQTNANFLPGKQLTGKDLLTVFVPTTPNPTSGFIVLIPREEAMELNISVDDALKMVISLGVVVPNSAGNAAEITPTT